MYNHALKPVFTSYTPALYPELDSFVNIQQPISKYCKVCTVPLCLCLMCTLSMQGLRL